jgi:hypothetical protein
MLLLVASSSACIAVPSASPTLSPLMSPNPLAFVDEQAVIQAGKAGCTVFRSHQDEEPYDISVKLLPVAEADRLVNGSDGKVSYNMPDDMPVWVVQMQGKWHVTGGPQPTRMPDEPILYFNHCSVMLNAKTGIALGYRLERVAE